MASRAIFRTSTPCEAGTGGHPTYRVPGRIVVLDGCTLNPGDLSWSGLESLAPTTVYDRTPPDQTVPRAAGAEIVLTNKTVLDRGLIERLPRLRYVGVLATGYNVVDLAAARARGIPVTNVPDYGTPSVAQMVFAHLLNLTQRVADHAAAVREGAWARSEDFCFWTSPLVELEGLTMGIVGLGRIGRAVAGIALAFGMKVVAHDVAEAGTPEGVRLVDRERLFAESDVVTLHCPLTAENERMVDGRLLSLMKPTAFLINTARGPLLDEKAVADALEAGRIAGAGLDVLTVEPPRTDNPLARARNCYVTPHIAWATRAARQRLLDVAVANVRAFIEGRASNVVN